MVSVSTFYSGLAGLESNDFFSSRAVSLTCRPGLALIMSAMYAGLKRGARGFYLKSRSRSFGEAPEF